MLGTATGATNPQRTSDVTTGLLSPAASTVAIATAGLEAIRVTATGSVGIGTTAPAYPLDIGTVTTGVVAGFATGSAISDSPYIAFGATRAQFGYNGTNQNAVVQAGGGKGIEFNVNSNTFGSGRAMFITNAGRVGIGTTAPSYPLDIGAVTSGVVAGFATGSAQSDSPYVTIGGTRAQFGYDGTNQNAVVQATNGKGIEFNVNNSTFGSGQAMVITSAGSVGIGATNPGASAASGLVSAGSGIVEVRSSGADDSGVYIRRADQGTGLDLWQQTSSGWIYIDNRYAGGFKFRSNTNNAASQIMILNASGKLETFTQSNPTFTSQGDTGTPSTSGTTVNGVVTISNGTNYGTLFIGIDTSGNAWLQSSARNNLAINYSMLLNQNGGNVGIGMASPQATLDVNGYAKLKINSSAPATCAAAYEGSIAYTGTTTHYLCFCDGTSWKQIASPGTACTW